MKRIPRLSALAGAIIAAGSLMSLAPNSDGGPYGYYRGGYGPGYGAYSAYGRGPYVYGSPAGYSYPSYGGYGYQGYGAGPYGYGQAAGYGGTYNYRAYRPYNGAVSNAYGSPSYSPYGWGQVIVTD